MDKLIKASERHDNESEYQEDGVLLLEPEKTELKPPPMYKVLMLDDDFTPMDFVVEVLEQFFSLSREKATEIMLEVHNAGRGVCGVFTKDVAETKAALVIDYARAHNHPLYCKAEPDHNT